MLVLGSVDDFFPFGKDGDMKTFRRRRESELKNGRVAMFAAMGCSLAVVVGGSYITQN